MAKVKVMKEFIDIHTQERHCVDSVFEASKERIAEIQSVSAELIQVLPAEKKPASKSKKAGD